MAIDTENKRRSIVGLGGIGVMLPVPDTVIDQGDRQQIAGYYRGILALNPIVIPKLLFKLVDDANIFGVVKPSVFALQRGVTVDLDC